MVNAFEVPAPPDERSGGYSTPAADAYSMPLDQIDVSNPKLYQDDTGPYFERLRREDPVHYTQGRQYGPYWSVTKYKDIMAVETEPPDLFAPRRCLAASPSRDRPMDLRRPRFIAMDPPKHDEQRKVVQPIVAPANLAKLEGIDPRTRRRASSTACRATRPSTGSTRSRSS